MKIILSRRMLLPRCFWYFFRFFSLENFLVAVCLAFQTSSSSFVLIIFPSLVKDPFIEIFLFSLALLHKQAQIPCIYKIFCLGIFLLEIFHFSLALLHKQAQIPCNKMSLLSRYLLIGNISFFSRLASQASSHPQHVYNITLFCLKTQPPPLKRIW